MARRTVKVQQAAQLTQASSAAIIKSRCSNKRFWTRLPTWQDKASMGLSKWSAPARVANHPQSMTTSQPLVNMIRLKRTIEWIWARWPFKIETITRPIQALVMGQSWAPRCKPTSFRAWVKMNRKYVKKMLNLQMCFRAGYQPRVTLRTTLTSIFSSRKALQIKAHYASELPKKANSQ